MNAFITYYLIEKWQTVFKKVFSPIIAEKYQGPPPFMSKLDLNELSTSLKKGDNKMLELIFRQSKQYCLDKLIIEKNCIREEAEDIYVEAIINFREKILADKITYLTDVKYYLGQTCLNMFYVRLKQKQRWDRNTPDIERFFYESDYVIDQRDYDYERAMQATRKSWSLLKEKCKDIIHYFYIDRLKMSEIAEIMGFSSADVAKTVKARCYKKLQELANQINQKSN
ncbi:MAG: sigma-70 family RNA polymerase sigma factor [Bacteroidota bacterium]